MYCDKFGMGREQVMRMTAGMQQNFQNVGLPYKFTDAGLVAVLALRLAVLWE